MTRLLGIDLGTSSVKAVIVNETGTVIAVGAQEIALQIPSPGWAEQEPEDWWRATTEAVGQALVAAGPEPIGAIGLAGQMHGTVLLDRHDRALGPAIIWADQRSAAEVEALRALICSVGLAEVVGTAPATGFMAATLRWFQGHDPARLAHARTCLLPKDYVRLHLTGEIATDASDAASTALFDVRSRQWSLQLIEVLELPRELFPRVLQSAEVAGQLTSQAAARLGLPPGIPVVAGCADQVAQALGNGLLEPGIGSVTIGTGGQLFLPLAAPITDPELRLHIFCHAPPDRWYVLGAMLAAGLALRWLRDLLGLGTRADAYTELAAAAAGVPLGADGLRCLPYFAGERAPVLDPAARATLLGLALHHGRGHVARAVMEGVACALRQILETIRSLNVPIERLVASGNGLGSSFWRQIVADVFGLPLYQSPGREHAGVGAALLAGIGSGCYASFEEASAIIPTAQLASEPIPANVQRYAEIYGQFTAIYPTLKPLLVSPTLAPTTAAAPARSPVDETRQ